MKIKSIKLKGLICFVLLLSGCGVKTPISTEMPILTVTPAFEEPSAPTSNIIELTAEEIETANNALCPTQTINGQMTATDISCCFTSYYEDPSELNLNSFLSNYSDCELVTDENEFQMLKERYLVSFNRWWLLADMPVPVKRIMADSVNDSLREFFGISLTDLKEDYRSRADYLAATDAFYNISSGFSTGTFFSIRGEREGNIVKLYSNEDESCLTLEKVDGSWLIRSFMLTSPPEETPEPEPTPVRLQNLRTEADIVLTTDTVTLYTYPVDGEELITEEAGTLLTVKQEGIAPDGSIWLLVERPVYKIPAESKGWVQAEEVTPFDDSLSEQVRSQVYVTKGETYYLVDGSGQIPLTKAEKARSELRGKIVDIEGDYARVSIAGGLEIWVLRSSLEIGIPEEQPFQTSAQLLKMARSLAEELGLPLDIWGAELVYHEEPPRYCAYFPVTDQKLWVQVELKTDDNRTYYLDDDEEPKVVTPPNAEG